MRAPFRRAARFPLPALALLAVLPGVALAQEPPPEPPAPGPPEGWFDTADLSYVLTSGNSETTTLGFKNKLWRQWSRALFTLNAAALRAESTTVARSVDPGPPAGIVETETEALTAEAYLFNGRYERNITDRFNWFTGAGWERNRFAGVENRYSAAGGLGNIWHDSEDLMFRTSYGVTFTKQEDININPEFDDTFLGLQLNYDYRNKFGASTTFTSTLVLDENLEDTSDWRANMVNAVAVTMSERLALKVSLTWLYDHSPALVAVDDPLDLLPPVGPTALAELEELDTIFTTSLVINF